MSIIQAKPSKGSWSFDLILLTAGIALVFSLFLGTRPLSVPDEGRYAEIPREMLVLHDFVTPHLNEIKYFEKPPLFYWLQAGAIKALNPLIIKTENIVTKPKKNHYLAPISEWTIRLPNAIIAVLGCLLVYAAGRILFERRAGLLSAIILASSLLYFALARMVTLDMTLSMCLSGSLLAFLVASNQSPGLGRRFLFYSAYIFAGLAVLTKGLIGIIFPIMIIGLWILLLNQWRLLKECYLPSGIFLFLLIVLPWHVLVQTRNPEFFQFYFIDQQILRYSTLIAQRYQPDWFFIPIFIAGFLPWVCFFPQAIMSHFPRNLQQFKEKKNYIFILLWIAIIFLFFSFSHSKLIPYILPIFPGLALLTGHYLSIYWKQFNTIKWGYIAVPLVWLGLGAVGILCLANDPSITLSHIAKNFLITGYGVFLLNSIMVSCFIMHKKSKMAFITLAIGSVISFLIVSISIPQLDTRSIKPLVTILKPLLKPKTKVFAYDDYYQDLPFYLNQRVFAVNVSGELSFGMQHQNTHAWMLNDANFWPIWNSHEQVYMIANKEIYQRFKQSKTPDIFLLAQTEQDVLLSNHPKNLISMAKRG
ncbi:MAG: undecaprenyl-diphospho-4-amino-4-deoxy-L-arabinose--lipid 4-amino-4-deoxy-L-arabinose transferase [Pseudomonadota bacterium]|jgi:4-amino-4-deoxy-L-arabinose transferase-like glycosyltransferase